MKRYITTIQYLLTTLFIVGFVFFGRGAPTAEATAGDCATQSDPSTVTGNQITSFGSAPDYTYSSVTSATNTRVCLIGTGGVLDIPNAEIQGSGGNFYRALNGTSGGSGTSVMNNFIGSTTTGNIFAVIRYSNFANVPVTETTYDIVYAIANSTTTLIPYTPVVANCSDGIQNQDETGIDVGGVCNTIVINTPVDGGDTSEFTNFSITYTGVDIPDQNHQIVVQWSDNSSLLTTCNDGVAGSLYTGSFVAGASYSTCTNSIPRIYIDYNTISFSSGIQNYTGSVPKSHSLVNGTTYYAQAFIVGDDGFYYVASDVVSFTASGGVPVVTGNGTITNTAGSGTITGTGTHFTSTLHIGDTLTVGGQQCKVLSIASDTELECTPLTSAHTSAGYTQNSNFDSSVMQETCSTWDIGCYVKNVVVWFFGVSDSNLQAFGNLTLTDRLPFSYIADTKVLFGDVFDQSADSFSLDIDLMGSSFTVLSTAQLEAISFQPLVRTIMGAMAMFFTVMFIYRKVIKVHDAGHHTA